MIGARPYPIICRPYRACHALALCSPCALTGLAVCLLCAGLPSACCLCLPCVCLLPCVCVAPYRGKNCTNAAYFDANFAPLPFRADDVLALFAGGSLGTLSAGVAWNAMGWTGVCLVGTAFAVAGWPSRCSSGPGSTDPYGRAMVSTARACGSSVWPTC